MFIGATPRPGGVAAALLVAACLAVPAASRGAAEPAPARGWMPPQSTADALPHGTGDWDPERFGNHRVVVEVDRPGGAVRVRMPWRRPDDDPQGKALIVTDAAGNEVANVVRLRIDREVGEIAFEPIAGSGRYFVYYLPWVSEGRSNYPTVHYPPPSRRVDAAWARGFHLDDDGIGTEAWRRLPAAEALAIESIDEFNSFAPMEIIATAAETEALLEAHPDAGYLVFPESRRYPVRMADDLPLRWIEAGPGEEVVGEAHRGEWYAFQLGVWAAREAIADIDVAFTALEGPSGGAGRGAAIPRDALRCVTTGGVDWTGAAFDKLVKVPAGNVQSLWCGVQVPEQIEPGEYAGRVTVAPTGMEPTTVPIRLAIAETAIVAAGDDEPWRHSRLRWLDSTIALDDEVVAPYEPVRVDGRRLSILGRDVTIGDDGMPVSIRSFFPYEMTSVGDTPRELLAAPVALQVVDGVGAERTWRTASFDVESVAEGLATWRTTNRVDELTMQVVGRAEFDGTLDFEISLSAAAATPLTDVRLRVPIARDVARYMMGMGRKGGLRPASFEWSWNVERNQDGAWIGDVNAGLQFSMRDERYVRPLNTNFYQLKPLVMPRSWDNDGQGGCRMEETAGSGDRAGSASEAFEVVCFSGARTLAAGESLRFDFRLLVTPFHPLDTDRQWRTRFFHRYRPLDEIESAGATVINVHHATEINPYINYPFMRPDQMKAYVDAAHARGMKVKIYYTVRELSNIAPELFALLGLGDEVFSYGPGGGFSWLQEHVDRGYIGGWFVPSLLDAAIVTSGTSRWHNYYLEGLDWLARNVGIDGLYIDDVAFDRTVMKRVRKILDRRRPGALIDLHSANQYNPRDGFANSANLYLEHFPFIDRLWFGEYFDYGSAPDFWMTEVSGIPFGLMGEMLQDGGNPWRGMLWGMTNRLPWTEDADPRPLWRAWDAFGMQGSRMIGFWVPERPVRSGREDVLVTTYLQEDRALVSIASWAEEPVDVTLQIDWAALGIDPTSATITAAPIENFQPGRAFAPDAAIPVEPGRGWLLTIR
jgi:hypothetical protein